jgi:hypothetical protein
LITKEEKKWKDVCLRCDNVWGELRDVCTWKRSWRHCNLAQMDWPCPSITFQVNEKPKSYWRFFQVWNKRCNAKGMWSKLVRCSFPIQTTHSSLRSKRMIHSYMCTIQIKFIGRCKYYVSFINDHTKDVLIFFMKHKGEMF